MSDNVENNRDLPKSGEPDNEENAYRETVRTALRLSSNRVTQLDAEFHLVKALNYNRNDAVREKLIHELAKLYFMKGNLGDAINLLVLLLEATPSNVTYLQNLADAVFWSGDIDAASNLYKKLISISYLSAKLGAERRNEPITQLIHPHSVICRVFGEMAGKIDLYVKARILGLTPTVEAILPAPEEDVPNKCLLDYWKKFAPDHVRIVSDKAEITHYVERHKSEPVILDCYEMPDGRAYERVIAYPMIQRQWEDEGRPPLLRITPSHEEDGRRRLRDFGVPPDAWFICLHAREAGYYKETVSGSHNTSRNARIDDFLPAIKAVTARGGWVFRIGDPSMTPLPPMDNVVDYANHPLREESMDIFLIGSCRLFVGTNSGPIDVAYVFGIPTLLTNLFPLLFRPLSRKDVFIHKLLRMREENRYLTIAEAVRPPLIGVHHPDFFADRGIEVLDNTSEDILDAVVEVLDIVEGKRSYSKEDEELQQTYKGMSDYFGLGISSRVGGAFLRKHAFLIGA